MNYKYKANRVSNKTIISIILKVLLLILSLGFYILTKYTFDSQDVAEKKNQSKIVLKEFIEHHMNKHDVKYTKNIIKPMVIDSYESKESFSETMALEISEKSVYKLAILEFSGSNAYYIVEIPTKHPSESKPDFVFTYYIKMKNKNNIWKIEKICSSCDIKKY